MLPVSVAASSEILSLFVFSLLLFPMKTSTALYCEKTAESPSRKDLMVLFVYLKTASGKKLHYFCSELFVVLVQKVVNLKKSF